MTKDLKITWCCVNIITDEVDPDSIGNGKYAAAYYSKQPAMLYLKTLSEEEAIEVICDDILNFDDEGLRTGNYVRAVARRKLKERMK